MCILQADFRWPFRGSLTSAFHLGCIGIPRGNGSPLHRWVSAVRYGCLWDIPPFLLSLRPPVLPSCLVVFWHTLASFCQNAASSGLFQCHLAIFSVPFGYFFSTIWLFFSIISLRFPPKTAACAGLSYTFPFILHAILHTKRPIIADNFQWWCRTCRRFPEIFVGVCACLGKCL